MSSQEYTVEMEPGNFWKNFRLGDELDISGAFIYNGLRHYHEMDTLDSTPELFECLYALSVGMERLLKIIRILYEHDDQCDQDELEKSLITHKHLDLVKQVKKHTGWTPTKEQYSLLELLHEFYKTSRYDRFNLKTIYHKSREQDAVKKILARIFGVEFEEDPFFVANQNTDKFKKFIQKHITSLAIALYKLVCDRSRSLNIFTHELKRGSKAESVFSRKLDLNDEDILWKEILIFVLNNKEPSDVIDFIKNIEPMPFDNGMVQEYLMCFKTKWKNISVAEALEDHYSEFKGSGGNIGDRLRQLDAIADYNGLR